MTKYKATATYKVYHSIEIEADTPEGAERRLDELISKIDWQNKQLDTLISAYSTKTKEMSNA